MHDQLARRLRHEALASRPAPSPTLLHQVRAAIAAEPAGQEGATRPRLPVGGWMAIQAAAVVAVTIVTIVVMRAPSVPSASRDTEAGLRMTSVPAADAPPIEQLVTDLRTELEGMAAALIGLPEWNEVVDLEASLAVIADPAADRP